MNRKRLYFISSIFFILFLPIFLYGSLQSCFDQFVINLNICKRDFANDPVIQAYCVEGAWEIFKRCIDALRRDQTSQLYGAKIPIMTFKRAEGKPLLSTEQFVIDADGTYYFNLYNGAPDDTSTKVSSALVQIQETGQTIFSPSDFNKNVNFESKPLFLPAGTYTLNVSLRSQPGSYFTLIISDRDFSTVSE